MRKTTRYAYAVLIAVLVFIGWALANRAEAADLYTCFDDQGAVLYTSTGGAVISWRCSTPVLNGVRPTSTVRHEWTDATGAKKQADVKFYSGTGQGVWTWVAPTVTGNLDHYLMFRQVGTSPATVYAQIDGRTQKLLLPMGTADFGACFWFESIAKVGPSVSTPSNKICLGANGLPLPAI